jgi:hypothetical protein
MFSTFLEIISAIDDIVIATVVAGYALIDDSKDRK